MNEVGVNKLKELLKEWGYKDISTGKATNVYSFSRKKKLFQHGIEVVEKDKTVKITEWFNEDTETLKTKQVENKLSIITEYINSIIEKANALTIEKPPVEVSKDLAFTVQPTGWILSCPGTRLSICFNRKGKIILPTGYDYKGKPADIIASMEHISRLFQVLSHLKFANAEGQKYELIASDSEASVNDDGSFELVDVAYSFETRYYREWLRFTVTPGDIDININSIAKGFKPDVNRKTTIKFTDKTLHECLVKCGDFVKLQPGFKEIFAGHLDGSVLKKSCILCGKPAKDCYCTAKQYNEVSTDKIGVSEHMLQSVLDFLSKKKISAGVVVAIKVDEA